MEGFLFFISSDDLIFDWYELFLYAGWIHAKWRYMNDTSFFVDRCDVSSVLVPDANVDGGNRNMAGSDVTECENVCINMTSCLGFDWSRENSECYLLPPGVESINYNVYGVDHYSLIRNTNHCIGQLTYSLPGSRDLLTPDLHCI